MAQVKIQQALPKIEVRKKSVAGEGAFAGEFIAAGTTVLPITGKKVFIEDLDWPNYDKKAMQIGDGVFLEEMGEADDFVNHSCDPNVAFSPDGLSFIALRDIKAGEELFYDYCTSEYNPDWSFICRCGSAKCRALMAGFVQLSPREQEKLAPIALPYIREHYKNRT